ncbi:hypothetical protein C8J57DRAFT_1236510 [Mycena rebaudengoi]|nr:hypothetical protein C8J57DRAFT_1236510 [Mycena rebaudengoi]
MGAIQSRSGTSERDEKEVMSIEQKRVSTDENTPRRAVTWQVGKSGVCRGIIRWQRNKARTGRSSTEKETRLKGTSQGGVKPELERGVRTCYGDAHKKDEALSLTMGLATAWGGSQTSFWGSTGAECLPRSVMVQRPLRPLFWCPTVSAPYRPNPDATTARKVCSISEEGPQPTMKPVSWPEKGV